MKRYTFRVSIIVSVLTAIFPCYADSIKVGDKLYEGVYLQTYSGGYNILFPDGQTLNITRGQYDPTSLVFSPPLERLKLEEAWKNSPLQKRLVEEEKARKEREAAQRAEAQRLQELEKERQAQEAINKAGEEKARQIFQEEQQAKQQEEKEARRSTYIVFAVLLLCVFLFFKSRKIRRIVFWTIEVFLTGDSRLSRKLSGKEPRGTLTPRETQKERTFVSAVQKGNIVEALRSDHSRLSISIGPNDKLVGYTSSSVTVSYGNRYTLIFDVDGTGHSGQIIM